MKDARAPIRGGAADCACVIAGVALTLALTLYLSGGRLLWEDEVLGWVLLRDPSWTHVLQGWLGGADGGGALFYLTGRVWFALFGDTNASFRLYSGTCFALAFVLLWRVARRYYTLAPALVGFLAGWFLNPAMVPHIGEGRFYGLLLATTAGAAAWVVARIEQPASRARTHLATFLVFSAVTTSHILGICYVGVLVLAWFISDTLRRRRQWAGYWAAAASVLWLIPSYPAIHASAAVGKPHFWTKQPTLPVFFLAYLGSSTRGALLLCALLALLTLGWLLRRRAGVAGGLLGAGAGGAEVGAGGDSRLPILAIGGGLFLIPILFYVEGFLATPLFDKRYLQPIAIGTVILFCEVMTRTQAVWLYAGAARTVPAERRRVAVWGAAAAALFCVALAAVALEFDFNRVPDFLMPAPNYARVLSASLPPRSEVLCEDAFTFTELMPPESAGQVHYVFLLDWDNALNPAAPLLEVTQFHLMQNWKRLGYYADHVADRTEFLAQHPYFLVLHTNQDPPARLKNVGQRKRDELIGNPLAERFAADPAFRELPYTQVDFGRLHEVVSLVCRREVDCEAVRERLRAATQTATRAVT